MEMPPKHVRFTHTPLDLKNEEIRLVTIEPSSEPSSPIQVTMKHFDFSGHVDACARYCEKVARLEAEGRIGIVQRDLLHAEFGYKQLDFIALSYTWGPEFPVENILVTSRDCQGWLSVRQNLYEFLKVRRDCDSAWLWVDQICINQGEGDERAHQVNKMADIYSVAAVEVWLGSGFKGSDEFVDLIVRESVLSSQHPRPKISVSEEELRNFIPSWHHFIHLPYWSRLWVIQEIILGKVVDIRIGSKVLSWYTFYSGWQRLEKAWRSLGAYKVPGSLEAGLGPRLWEIEDKRAGTYQN